MSRKRNYQFKTMCKHVYFPVQNNIYAINKYFERRTSFFKPKIIYSLQYWSNNQIKIQSNMNCFKVNIYLSIINYINTLESFFMFTLRPYQTKYPLNLYIYYIYYNLIIYQFIKSIIGNIPYITIRANPCFLDSSKKVIRCSRMLSVHLFFQLDFKTIIILT